MTEELIPIYFLWRSDPQSAWTPFCRAGRPAWKKYLIPYKSAYSAWADFENSRGGIVTKSSAENRILLKILLAIPIESDQISSQAGSDVEIDCL